MYGLSAGTRIGAYVLEQQLGAGGQGSVWRGRSVEQPEAPVVALKIIPVRGTPPSLVERVRREAEALIRLSTGQPSIVACHGLIEDGPLGVLAVIMELVDGVEFEAAMRDARCDAAAREQILLHVARALGHLHDAGVVHRDVKPQNILVKHSFFASPGDPSTVKLVDFGIATPKGNPKPLTEVGTVIGTPAFMAPERIDPMFWPGVPGSPTEDVWALGVVAYESLFGRHPAGVEDDGTLSTYAERYRALARSGEAWPSLPGGHRWASALRGALALKSAERLADGKAVAAAVMGEGVSGAVGSGGGRKTEIGAPMPASLASPGAGAGFTQQGAVFAGGAGAGPASVVAGGDASYGGYPTGAPVPGQTGVGAVSAQPGWPAGGASVPAVVPAPPVGRVPPPPGGGGGGGAKRISPAVMALGGVGVLAVAVPVVVLISRAFGGSSGGHSELPAEPTAAPTVSVPEAPTFSGPVETAVPPPVPTMTAPPVVPTGTPQPGPRPTSTAPATATTQTPPAPTAPPTAPPTSTQVPPPIGKGTSTGQGPTPPPTAPTATSTATSGRPSIIKILKGGGVFSPPTSTGGGGAPPPAPTATATATSTNTGGRPPIKIRPK